MLEGEAVFHIARFGDTREVAQQVESFQTDQIEAPFPVTDPPVF